MLWPLSMMLQYIRTHFALLLTTVNDAVVYTNTVYSCSDHCQRCYSIYEHTLLLFWPLSMMLQYITAHFTLVLTTLNDATVSKNTLYSPSDHCQWCYSIQEYTLLLFWPLSMMLQCIRTHFTLVLTTLNDVTVYKNTLYSCSDHFEWCYSISEHTLLLLWPLSLILQYIRTHFTLALTAVNDATVYKNTLFSSSVRCQWCYNI